MPMCNLLIMTGLPSNLYIHLLAWPEAPDSVTPFALSRRDLLESPLLDLTPTTIECDRLIDSEGPSKSRLSRLCGCR